MQLSALEQRLVDQSSPEPRRSMRSSKAPALTTVWHDYVKEPDVELCIAKDELDTMCGLVALYGDGPTFQSMKYCAKHMYYDGFKPTHILQDTERKDDFSGEED
jgi:hypothetical protein